MTPDVSYPVAFFSKPIQAIKHVQEVVNGFLVNTEELVDLNAVIQPVLAKEKAQLSYDLWIDAIRVHTLMPLDINDTLIYKNKRYLINAKGDYSNYGYYEYIALVDMVRQ
ncbi:MAG: hypothetical protein LBG21_02910 [Campylobacteraceae bacterium]|jgi:hypothetical protein|nr:hypothetical protein [Campylobacteraceae bacterium]